MNKELNRILDFFENKEGLFALAMVAHVEGSSYRRMGAKLLVSHDGTFEGGISGGCLEGDALKHARLVILNQKPKVIRYDTSIESEIGIGLGCNGIIDVLFIPIVGTFNRHIDILKNIISNTRRETIKSACLIQSPIDSELGNIYNQQASFRDLNIDLDLFESNQVLIVDQKKFLIEIYHPKIRVLIFGNQYDVYPLYEMLQYIGYEPIVVASKSKLRDKIDSIENIDNIWFDGFTAAILMSHSIEKDISNLALLNSANLKYIGILGPRTRTQKILTQLGNNIPHLSTLFYPIGLDIGAENPTQIALSICSEIQAVFNQREGGHLKNRILPINNRK